MNPGEHDGQVSEQIWADRQVLVTGATGMVGSWLCRRLVQAGASVVGLVADWDPRSELMRSGTINQLHVVNGRLEDQSSVERAIVGNDIDTVFHLGAQTIVGTARRSPRATFESNIQGTWNVLDACRLHRDLVKRVVVASSDKAYGEQPELPYVETMPLAGRHPYEVSKSCTDLLATSYAHTYGLPVLIARCGNIFGGGDSNWSRIVPGTFRSLLRGEQPVLRSDGSFVRDYLHVDEVVDAYLVLAAHADRAELAGEAFNFSDETPLTVMEIYRACCTAAGRPDVEPLVLGEAAGEIKDQYLDASKARLTLGWKSTVPLAEGLARTYRWYHALLAPAP
jgi:CDP-glucose 4,6-dehydratase